MVLQKKCEAFWQSWWVGGDENGSGRGRPRCSKSELEVLILFGEKLNPSSWQPGVSQTPAQLLALRFPPAGTQVPCCSGRCTGTCSKSRRCQDKAATQSQEPQLIPAWEKRAKLGKKELDRVEQRAGECRGQQERQIPSACRTPSPLNPPDDALKTSCEVIRPNSSEQGCTSQGFLCQREEVRLEKS